MSERGALGGPGGAQLRRAVNLPLLVLYGLGVTIGAGIYVLIGETVAQAGVYAPMSFLIAAIVMGFSAASFCELSGRYPQSAGEAIYVDEGFGIPALTLATGLLMVLAATVSAAAITLGGAGYISTLAPLAQPLIVSGIVVVMAGVAAWGIVESLTFAAIFTCLEILGLLAIVVSGFLTEPDLALRLPEVVPPIADAAALSAVFAASLIAFFAFIGFDDMVNLVEETKDPKRTLPLGILLTLTIATLLYFLVAFVAVLLVPLDDLSGAAAPISLIFVRLTALPPFLITLVAIVATLNGIVIQIVMAARVLYGLGKAGRLPPIFAAVNAVTRTPVFSTTLVSALVLGLALYFPLGVLAERTTQVILTVFVLVNAALIMVKRRDEAAPDGIVRVPLVVPIIGVCGCLAMLIGPILFG